MVLLGVACATLLSAAGPARADTVTIGQVAPPGGPISCADCTIFQVATAGASPSYEVPPGEWTITSWSFSAGPSANATSRLRVFRPTATPGQFLIAAQSNEETAATNTTQSFATSIPVEPGDRIGLRTGAPVSTPLNHPGSASDATGLATDGGASTVGQTIGPGGNFSYTPGDAKLVNVAAVLEGTPPQPPPPEPEAGDQNPPQTTITGVPKKRRNRHSYLSFSSSEPGSSFRCSLDSGGFESCSSPQDYRNLKRGPHTFAVFAIDPAGNADPTPAEHEWKVKARRK